MKTSQNKLVELSMQYCIHMCKREKNSVLTVCRALTFVNSALVLTAWRRACSVYPINHFWSIIKLHFQKVLSVVSRTSVTCCSSSDAAGLLYMLLKHYVDRYNIYFAYHPSKINRRIHTTAINFVIISLFILQLMLLIFIVLRAGRWLQRWMRVAGSSLSHCTEECGSRQASHTRQHAVDVYNMVVYRPMVVVKGRWSSKDRKVTVGLVSDWPCVTDWLKCLRQEDEHPWSINHQSVIFESGLCNRNYYKVH